LCLFAELLSVEEIAKGIKYTDPIKTSWRPPRYIMARSEHKNEDIRKRWNILVEGLIVIVGVPTA
jgi:ATP-dependent RNA helicase DDX41